MAAKSQECEDCFEVTRYRCGDCNRPYCSEHLEVCGKCREGVCDYCLDFHHCGEAV